jgi:hypothetical protein
VEEGVGEERRRRRWRRLRRRSWQGGRGDGMLSFWQTQRGPGPRRERECEPEEVKRRSLAFTFWV